MRPKRSKAERSLSPKKACSASAYGYQHNLRNRAAFRFAAATCFAQAHCFISLPFDANPRRYNAKSLMLKFRSSACDYSKPSFNSIIDRQHKASLRLSKVNTETKNEIAYQKSGSFFKVTEQS
jgi:hypothetical protein